MRRNAIAYSLLVIFAAVAGHYAVRIGGQVTPEFFVQGTVQPMRAAPTAADRKNVYFRRTWEMTQPPQHAWVQVLGHDQLDVFVNGERLGVQYARHTGATAAIVADITQLLHPGKNSIAINAQQRILGLAPSVSVDAGFVLGDGLTRDLSDPAKWRMSDHYERKNTFWYLTEFDDAHWLRPTVGEPVFWRAPTEYPARGITTPPASKWIAPTRVADKSAAFRREFEVSGIPRSGWLRVTSSAPYRLAVNGVVLVNNLARLSVPPPFAPRRHLVDISPAVQPGKNVVAFSLTTNGEVPHIRADLEVENIAGARTLIGTDEAWHARGGNPSDWLEQQVESADWPECVIESGELGMHPCKTPAEYARAISSPKIAWKLALRETLAMLASGVVALLGVWVVQRLMSRLSRKTEACVPSFLPFAAFVPSILAGLFGILLTYDTSFGQADVYTPLAWASLWALLLLQWAVLLAIAVRRSAWRPRATGPRRKAGAWAWMSRVAPVLAILLIAGLALWLRVRNILAEPVHHDEVGAYAFTVGVLKYGFPGGQIHPDIPFGYCATSELVYFFNAPFALVFDNPLLVIRVPTVCWSIATVFLIYYVGRRLFNVQVGLLAALLYALSPYTIGMANFGRYFSQLQFFALLATYFFYETIRGDGPINRRALWLTAASFCAMYLSWEGSGFLAPGMALAALLTRRGRLRTIFLNPSIYAALTVCILVFLAQNSHRTMQQTQRIWMGTGISELTIVPMWRYPLFFPDFYFKEASWIQESFLPMIGLVAGILLAFRSRFQAPLRVLLVIFLGNCGMMTALLPLRAGRYSYHLVPLLLLIFAVAVVVLAGAVVRLGRTARAPSWCRGYASGLAVATLATVVVLVSGRWVFTNDMTDYRTTAYPADALRFPDWEGPLKYVREHFQEGDIVMTIYPHAIDFVMYKTNDPLFGKNWKCDYWLQTTLVLQSTLDDYHELPRDRRAGTLMIPDKQHLEFLFKQNKRIWYLTLRRPHNLVNDLDVSKLVREQMDVVYEDFRTSVLLRDNRNRTASIQDEDEQMMEKTHEWFLN